MTQWGCCCTFCRLPLSPKQLGVCSACIKNLPELPPCCLRCGLRTTEPHVICQQCDTMPPFWQHIIAVTDYVTPLTSILHQFKFHGQFHYAKMLARLILLKWLDYRRNIGIVKPHLVVPVPLHKWRQLSRGFNQSDMMAAHIAHWLGAQHVPHLLRRSAGMRDQKTLSADERRHNLSDAFSCHRTLDGLDIALVDDIVTTGSTANEISRVLLDKGAASVQLLCVCRTL